MGDSISQLVSSDDKRHVSDDFPEGCGNVALNSNKRVDYTLQEHVLEGMSEYLSSLGGHTNYFHLPDVGRFIVERVAVVPLKLITY